MAKKVYVIEADDLLPLGGGLFLVDGTLLPAAADVKAGVAYGPRGSLTGELAAGEADYPAEADVRDGTEFDDGAKTGSLDLPASADVRDGTKFDGETKEGTLDLPAASDVKAGVKFDGESKEGTLVLPPLASVRRGVVYGAGTGKLPMSYLPRTGQTTSYDDGDDAYWLAGYPVNGSLTGLQDDSEWRLDYDIADGRWQIIDSDWEIVGDLLTGLMTPKRFWDIVLDSALATKYMRYDIYATTWLAGWTATIGEVWRDDADNDGLYCCLVTHTTAGANMAAERAANPTYWRALDFLGSYYSGSMIAWKQAGAWGTAIDLIERMNTLEWGGYDDWRMPNITELLTFAEHHTVDVERNFNAVALWAAGYGIIPPNWRNPKGGGEPDMIITRNRCWSSTSFDTDTSVAWGWYAGSGQNPVFGFPKAVAVDLSVFPVRGGMRKVIT